MTLTKAKEIKDMVYTIRGEQVMLDSDLAELYGYDVKVFNRQVKRNIERFPERYMFQLTLEEVELVRCQFGTSPNNALFKGQDGGRRYLPFVFTEQGVYMLSAVLSGDLAVSQSIMIMDTFKEMRHFIADNLENNSLSANTDFIKLSQTVQKNSEDIGKIMAKFVDNTPIKEHTFLAGQMFTADEAYNKIFSSANHTIHLIDNYVSIRTLSSLKCKKDNVSVTILTENKANPAQKLQQRQVDDFNVECPTLTIKMNRGFHDRYIVIDLGTPDELWYHCGVSNKDAGKEVSTINVINDVDSLRKLLNLAIADSDVLFD